VTAVLATACANQGAPPGGPVDVRPPVVVRTEPDTFATLADLDGQVRFHFDERISETAAGGTLDDAVTVSPTSGEVRVGHGRSTLSVEVEGGFRPGLLYRVTLLPVVSDMFGNRLRDPFELVFSTGGTAPPSAVAGQAWNRTTGVPLSGALVYAVGADSLTHMARADQEGIYVLRYLPEGPYRITAFDDVDRDRVLDPREMQGGVDALVSASDTLLLDVGMLPYDTTSAQLMTASALDSVTVVLEFDDYLDDESPAEGIALQIAAPDGQAKGVARVYHERDYNEYVDSVVDSLFRVDSIATADRAAAPIDSLGAAADTTAAPAQPAAPLRRGPPALVRAAARRGPDRPLPARRLVAVLAAPLEVGVEHAVQVGGAVNVNGIGGGSGEATLLLRPPDPPEDDRDAPSPGGVPGVPPGPNDE
jgi:hypothetical protein